MLPGTTCARGPGRLSFGIVGGEEGREDLTLERVGVLELVDEEPAKSLLQFPAHRRVGREQVARQDEQIEEIELARLLLRLLVGLDDAAQLAAKRGGELGVGAVEAALEALGFVAARRSRTSWREDALGLVEPLAGALPAPEPLPLELAERRLERVVVARLTALFAAIVLRDDARDLLQRLREPAVGEALRREVAELAELLEHPVDLGRTVDGGRLVKGREIALFDEVAAGFAERRARPVLIALAGRAAEHARDAGHLFRLARERVLKPGGEGLVVEALLLVLGRDLEERIDARLDGTLAQDVGAERVNGPDARRLELLERVVETLSLLTGR